MGYEEGFEALNNGDYRRAMELLERAASDTAYASDIINNACTLALYRAGERSRLADISFRVASGLLADDPASAMDYFQRAIHAGLDLSRIRRIGEIYEEWMGERRVATLQGQISRVGHIVPSLEPDQPTTPYLRRLTASLKEQGMDSTVFTTESTAYWFFNPTSEPRTHAQMTEGFDAQVSIASVEGDFIERAERIAASIRDSGIPLVFYHGGLADQIGARVAALRPASLQVSVNHDVETDADLFDGFIHLSQNALERSRYSTHPAAWIPPGPGLIGPPDTSGMEMRQSLGSDVATVSAGLGGGSDFVQALSEILKRFPRHYHLFAGGGEIRSVRGLLHAEGVLPRVRFLGQNADMTRLIDAVDVYLAPFPDTGRAGILEMMSAGKPVVALRHAGKSEFNSAAELVGHPELTPLNRGAYIHAADRLIRDAALRTRLGEASRDRCETEFHPSLLGKRYVEFLGKLR